MLESANLQIDTSGWLIRGQMVHWSGQTILQDAGRVGNLLLLTVMAQQASSLKWVPLTDINPILTAAKLVCGANGALLAAWQAIADGEFSITIDEQEIDLIGLDFTAITALKEIEEIINLALNGIGSMIYNTGGDYFTFFSASQGLPKSSITVLSPVVGGVGTDISGAGFLNGVAGAVTAATGGNGEDIPAGLFIGQDILEADIQAGDVTAQNIVKGKTVEIDEDKIVLENGLTLDDVVYSTGKTIRAHLAEIGIYAKATRYFQQYQPIA